VSFELRLSCPAQSEYVARVRHTLTAFLQGLELDRDLLADVTIAAGEALANAVEHAYERGCERPRLALRARLWRTGRLCVEVSDHGSFIERGPVPGRGLGLQIIRAIAGRLTIDTAKGTRVRMIFER